jgi:Major capsid protein Gp23
MSFTLPLSRHYDPVTDTFMPPLDINKMMVYRKLKAEYTPEVALNMKAINGLDAEAELTSLISSEILKEIHKDIWEIALGRRENPLDFLFDEEAAEAELDRQLAEVDRIKAWKPMGRDIDPTLTWMIGYDGTTEEDDYEEAT